MAQQIKKKYIQDDAIDGEKLKLVKGQSVRGEDQQGQEVDLLKLDQDDKVLLKGEEAALKSQVDAEQQRAEGEEARIEGKVDTEKTRAEGQEAAIRSEFAAADESVKSELKGDVEVMDTMGKLEDAINAEQVRAEGEESRIEGKVDTEISDRQSEITRVEGLVSAEEVRAMAEELRLAGLISDEEQARIDGDSDLDAKIQTEKARIDAILSASEADKDSFAEIVALINSVDTENDSAFASYVTSNNARSTQIETSVSQEILDRTNADNQLQANIDTEEAARIAADSSLQSSLNSEQAARISQDGILQDNIEAEQTRAETAEATLQSNIDTEEAARIAGDADLQSKLDVEIVRARSAEEDLQSAIDAEQTRAEAAETQLQSNIDQEVSDRETAVSAEQSRAEGQEAAIRSEFAAADSTLQSNIDAEEQSRIDGDNALDGRLSPIEGMLEYKHSTVHDSNAAVYADAQKGKEDANLREGWYYTNEVAGQKINWYFHDGQKDIVSLKDFSAYAVMTFDDASESPILGVYTFPTQSNDAASWYHSRVIYSGLSSTPEVGKKYVVYFGQNPEIHPELPRLELSKESSPFTIGEQLDDEIVMTSSFGTDSSAGVGNVKFMVESLGVHSPSHKTNVKLKIHHATQEEFDALQSQVNDLDSGYVSEAELAQAVSDLQDEIDADVLVEKQRAEGEESRIEGKLDQEITDRQTLEGEFDAYVVSNDQALADEVSARETLEGEFDAYVVSNDSALAQEVSDRQTLEGEFDQYVIDNNQALADEVSARETLEGEFDQYVIDNDSALAQEVSDREAADSTLQSNIDIEKGRIDAILNASTADADSFKEIVDLINSVDTENDEAFGSYVLSNDAKVNTLESEMDAVEGRLDIVEPKVSTLESEMDAVEGRLDIAEPKISTLESEMDSAEGRLDTLESEMDSVEANLAQELLDRASGDQNLQDQIDQINTDVSAVVQFGKESIEVTSQMITDGHIDLQVEIKPNSMVMFVDRLGMHEGLDYSVSTVDGVSRITFLSPMLQPSEEALEAGQFIRVTYGK